MISMSVLNGGITEENIELSVNVLFILAGATSVGHGACWVVRENEVLRERTKRVTKQVSEFWGRHKKPPKLRPTAPILRI